jgi:hypothetical protein
MLRPDDELYRKLNPDSWNLDNLIVGPEAFEDRHEDLSLYVARFVSPKQVLEKFAGYPGLRREFFASRAEVSAEDMCRRGFGIAVITCLDVTALGLTFKTYKGGCTIDRHGHCEVIRGKQLSLEISRKVVALTREQIFLKT